MEPERRDPEFREGREPTRREGEFREGREPIRQEGELREEHRVYEAGRREPEIREESRVRDTGRREPEPFREERGTYETGSIGTASFYRHSAIHWGSIWAGLVVALSIVVLLSVLGVALGITAIDPAAPADIGTAAGIWGAFTVIVALFVGGWIAASTSGVVGRWLGSLHGALVWALTLVIALFLSLLGLGAVLGALAFEGLFIDVGAAEIGGAAWGTLLGLLLALIAAAIGGFIGAREQREVRY